MFFLRCSFLDSRVHRLRIAARLLLLAAVLLGPFLSNSTSAMADDSARRLVLNEFRLDGDIGAFRVSVRAANVRERPATGARKTDLLKRGALVKSLGRVAGTRWYAVEQERQFIGFMYDKTLEPVPDKDLSDEQRLSMGLQPPEDPLEGLEIEPASGAFVAQKRDITIRAKPDDGSRSVDKLRRGERIEAIGRPKGHEGWVAVGHEGKAIGFLEEAGVMRVIDAAINRPLSGKVQIEGNITCAYELGFVGRTAVLGEVFGSADYSGNLACTRNGGLEMFNFLMFIIEGSRQTGQGDLHQVNLDVLELGDVERPFSVIMSYNSTSGVLSFDTASRANYIRRNFSADRPVADLRETLSSAIEIGLNALNETAWSELAGL
jgi:hypothetical protein